MWVEIEWRDGFMCVSTDASRSQRRSLVHWELKPTGSCEPPNVSVENWIQVLCYKQNMSFTAGPSFHSFL